MEVYKIENLSFSYPKRDTYAIYDINLSVNQGEFITLCGKSGCGKTTLLRLLKPILAPVGQLVGDIYFNGRNLSQYSTDEQAEQIGFVMQDPENQIVTDKVWHELAFGLESLGFSTSEIRARVSEMASFFGIENWFHKQTSELSGGQKQLLNLASIMVMQPSVLILDEPTSQLDPIAAQEFINTLKKINSELGTTVILSEHRLDNALPVSDRVIVMDEGTIIADGTPSEICNSLKAMNHDMYLALPAPMRIYGAVCGGTKYPLTVRDGRCWLEEYSKNNDINPELIPKSGTDTNNKSFIDIKDVWFRYEKNSPDIIKGMNIQINKGELFAIMGGNGVGKTTALSLINGINPPYRGKITIDGKKLVKSGYSIGALPQNPQCLFTKNTVYLELSDMLKKSSQHDEEINRVAQLCKIEHLLQSHPYDLSGGEQQRTALAKLLLLSPNILLLDEPTKGLDAQFKEIFAEILRKLKADGVTIIMVSHDIEFCAEYSDRCAMFFDGNITSVDKPREFFAGKSFYTTTANRMARTIIPNAVLTNDVILACGGQVERPHPSEKKEKPSITPYIPKQKNLKKRTALSAFLFLLAIPFTILSGKYLFGDRKYYFISLLIILESMIPFYMLFEKRKPQARELVVVSTLCAIAVAGRTAFFMLPQFKPVTALIIISGVCLGSESGFLIGTVTGFVSNFFFGQGPWTPWQMFSFGIIGFLSGMLFRKTKPNKLLLCIFGGITSFFIYGGIMNTASVLIYQPDPTIEMFISSYIMGARFDLIHAVSTIAFLWFLAKPMIEKIERIKTKYGLLER